MANDRAGFGPAPEVAPGGQVREKGGAPTDGELALAMWRRYMGDKPMPEHLRKKYGVPADDAPGFGDIPGRAK